MSGKSSGGGSSAPKQTRVNVPDPTSERTFVNGREVSNRLYDKGQRQFTSNIFLDDNEQQALDIGKKSFTDLIGTVRDQVPINEGERNKFIDSLVQPQQAQINDQYNRSLGQATNTANAAGVSDSVGFQDFVTNQLGKGKQQAEQNLYNQAYLQSFSLPGLKLDPIVQALSVFDTSIQSPTNRGLSLLDPSFQGSVNNRALDFQNAQLDLQSQQYNNTLRSSRGGSGGGGFFDSLF